MIRLTIMALLLTFSFSVLAQSALQPVDSKSKVDFTIRNIGIATHGSLSGLTGEIKIYENAIEKSSANVTVAVKTIDTDNERRDKHLRHADFFDAEKFPIIRLQSTSISKGETAGQYIFNGNLTIKSISKPIRFLFQVAPLGKGYMFSGTFTIDRLDFGVGKSSATLSDEVKVSLEVYAE